MNDNKKNNKNNGECVTNEQMNGAEFFLRIVC